MQYPSHPVIGEKLPAGQSRTLINRHRCCPHSHTHPLAREATPTHPLARGVHMVPQPMGHMPYQPMGSALLQVWGKASFHTDRSDCPLLLECTRHGGLPCVPHALAMELHPPALPLHLAYLSTTLLCTVLPAVPWAPDPPVPDAGRADVACMQGLRAIIYPPHEYSEGSPTTRSEGGITSCPSC